MPARRARRPATAAASDARERIRRLTQRKTLPLLPGTLQLAERFHAAGLTANRKTCERAPWAVSARRQA